jgi:fructokinase
MKNQTAPNKVLVVGECLVDLAPLAGGQGDPASARGAVRSLQGAQELLAVPGGSPANVALALARLGVPTAFAGRLSDQGFGPWLRNHLSANGVDLAPSIEADEPPTLAVVALDPTGSASYTFYGPGTADWQWTPSELVAPEALGDVSAVHTGSLALALPPGAQVLSEWLRAVRHGSRAVISVDPNVRPGFIGNLNRYRDHLTEVLRSAHIIKLSQEDLYLLAPGQDPADVAQRWLSAEAHLVVVTHGAEGATAFHRNGAFARCRAPEVEVADTIGAGDTFSAGLLAWLSDHDILADPGDLQGISSDDLEAALGQAASAAALACTRPGANPPDRDELEAFMARTNV